MKRGTGIAIVGWIAVFMFAVLNDYVNSGFIVFLVAYDIILAVVFWYYKTRLFKKGE